MSTDQPYYLSKFFRELTGVYHRKLQSMGWQSAVQGNMLDVGVAYYDLAARYIKAVPREVFRSDQMARHETKWGDIIDQLSEAIRAGTSLTPHLSRSLRKAGSRDYLMADWGIHHLHMSFLEESDGFTQRTGDRLFAKFAANHAYLIDIMPHGKWAEVELLDILARNWQSITEPWRYSRIMPGSESVSAAERHELRCAGVAVPVVLSDGSVLFPPQHHNGRDELFGIGIWDSRSRQDQECDQQS